MVVVEEVVGSGMKHWRFVTILSVEYVCYCFAPFEPDTYTGLSMWLAMFVGIIFDLLEKTE